MGLKENFFQAGRELLGSPDTTADSEAVTPESRRSAPFSRREEFFAAEAAPTPTPGGTPIFRDGSRTTASERTIIAAGTVVQGSIRATGGIELYGEVYGDIASKEGVKICGRLEGNATGQDIEVIGGRVKGDIVATGRTVIDNNAIILGNIRAENLLLNGKVKGNLDVKALLAMDTNAAVAGSVVAGRLSMAEGALLRGEVRISSADLDKLFSEEEPTGKRAEAEPPKDPIAPDTEG